MKSLYVAAVTVLILLSGCLLTGCNEWAIIRPTTELKVNPWTRTMTYRNTKDVDSKLDGFDLVYASTQPAEGPPEAYARVHIEKWDVTDNSSNVVRENVKQMEVAVEQMKQTNEMIKSAFAGLSNLASAMTPLIGQLRAMSTELAALRNDTVGDTLKQAIHEALKKEFPERLPALPEIPRGDAVDPQ